KTAAAVYEGLHAAQRIHLLALDRHRIARAERYRSTGHPQSERLARRLGIRYPPSLRHQRNLRSAVRSGKTLSEFAQFQFAPGVGMAGKRNPLTEQRESLQCDRHAGYRQPGCGVPGRAAQRPAGPESSQERADAVALLRYLGVRASAVRAIRKRGK